MRLIAYAGPSAFTVRISGRKQTSRCHQVRLDRRAQRHPASGMPRSQPNLCVTCGTQFAPDLRPEGNCTICDEERQYVGHEGQQWTSQTKLLHDGQHSNTWKEIEPGVTAIGLQPKVGIGQRAYFIQTEHGNYLWDLVSYLSPETCQKIQDAGGLKCIAISHPHYYCNNQDWAEAFDCPVHLPLGDKQWVMQPHPRLRFWTGNQLDLGPGVTMLRVGGHFAGSSVLHWAAGSQGKGSMFTGDTIQIVQDRRYVSFMWSFPNYIPLPAEQVRRIQKAIKPWSFDRLHGAFTSITEGGADAVQRSADRIVGILDGTMQREYF